MKKVLAALLIFISCNDKKEIEKPSHPRQNTTKHHLVLNKNEEVSSGAIFQESMHRKFYNSDEIVHYYLDISEESINKLLMTENRNDEQQLLLEILTGAYPTALEKNIEKKLTNFEFTEKKLNKIEKEKIENIFREKDSIQTSFSSCIPHYRDVFVFKRKDSVIGISKICFGCGVSKFIGSEINTDGFGLRSELSELKKLITKSSTSANTR